MLNDILLFLNNLQSVLINPVNYHNFNDSQKLTSFLFNFSFLILSITLIHSIIIYIISNLKSEFKHFWMIFISVLYAFTTAFTLGKIFQTFSDLILNYVPIGGSELEFLSIYGALIITYVFEVLLVKNRLLSLFERGHLDSEPIESDLFLGVTTATLLILAINYLI